MRTAGAFRHRVTIETRTATSGTFGSTAGAWSQSKRWCRRTGIGTALTLALAQRGHTERVERLSFRATLTIDIANTRFLIGGRHYRAIEPPVVDEDGVGSSVLVSQEAQR